MNWFSPYFCFQSFVNMINSKKNNYNTKFQELLGKLEELMNLSVKVKDTESPECFISYCWKNSAQAVALGTRSDIYTVTSYMYQVSKNSILYKETACFLPIIDAEKFSTFIPCNFSMELEFWLNNKIKKDKTSSCKNLI